MPLITAQAPESWEQSEELAAAAIGSRRPERSGQPSRFSKAASPLTAAGRLAPP